MKKAEGYMMESVEITRTRFGPDHRLTAEATRSAGMLLFFEGEYARAEPYCRDDCSYWLRNNPDQEGRWWSELRLGLCLLGQKRFPEAQPRLLSFYNAMKPRGENVPIESTRDLGWLIERITQLRDENGRPRSDACLPRLRFDPVLQAIVMDLQFPEDPFAPP